MFIALLSLVYDSCPHMTTRRGYENNLLRFSYPLFNMVVLVPYAVNLQVHTMN